MRKKAKEDFLSNEILLAEYEAVYRYVLSICHNEADANDITQETFLKAMWSAKSFEEKCSLYTWLCTIAKNIWINKCKKANREISTDEFETNTPNSSASLEQIIAEKDISKQIHIVLHTLDEPYKEVFSLRVFGELPFADIADLFSKTESWARVTYHRARKMIIEKLERNGLL